MTDRQRNGFILLLVFGLVLGSLVVIAGIPGGAVKSKKTVLGLDLKGGVELVYQGQPSPQTPKVTPDALQRAVDIMRSRVDQLGVAEPEIQTTGQNLITVGLPNVSDTARAEREVGTTAQLAFYDWEQNALTPNGKTVASQLQSQDPDAANISQGARRSAGQPRRRQHGPLPSGQLAAKQPESASSTTHASGPVLHVRRARAAQACAAAAKAQGTVPVSRPALSALGPDENMEDLRSGLPPGVTAVRGRDRDRPAGDGGAPGDPGELLRPDADRSPQCAVLRAQGQRRAARQRDQQPAAEHRPSTGQPDVTFGFNSKGKSRLPERDRGDRPARQPRQRPRAVAQPALRGRARQPADHGPVRSTTSNTRTGSTATTAPTSAAASRSARPRTSPTSCASARCRSSSS